MSIQSDTITINVCQMFSSCAPWDCSNSAANLGDQAGRLTWEMSKRVAERSEYWLSTDIADACEAIQTWAKSTGAWDAEEIAAWDDLDCLALVVQNVASALRERGSDDCELCEMTPDNGDITNEEQGISDANYLYVNSDGVLMFDLYCGC